MKNRLRWNEVLGVGEHASPDETKRAYRTLVRELHPDRVRDPELAREAEDRLKTINAAWNEFLAYRKRRETLEANERRSAEASRGPLRPETARAVRESAAWPPGVRPSGERRTRDDARAERAERLKNRDERERRDRASAERVRTVHDVARSARRRRERAHRVKLFRLAVASLTALGAAALILLLAIALGFFDARG